MINIEEFEILDQSFISQIEEFSKEEPFQLFYLFDGVNMVNYGPMNFYDSFILKKDNSIKIIGLLTDSNYYLYGKNWTEIELSKIRKRIKDSSFSKGLHIVGTHGLVNQLLDKIEIKTVDFKDRFFYKIVNRVELSNELPVTYPTMSDLIELATLCMEAHRDEYKEFSVRPLEDFINTTKNHILKSSIVINKNATEITGFCTAMYIGSDEPMIGTLYVRENYRNKKIGKSLLNFLTSKLMAKAKACYLVTERENRPANKVIESIGYHKIYEHIDKIITVVD